MKHTKYVVKAALVAALYVVLTYLAAAMGLSGNLPVQLRFSEALTILPFFTSAAIPGLTVGCFIANLLTGCAIWDVFFGTLATFIGACGTYVLRKRNKYLAPLPPIIANTLIVPFVLKFVYVFPGSILYFFITVFIGELLSCGILGILLLFALEKHKRIFNS